MKALLACPDIDVNLADKVNLCENTFISSLLTVTQYVYRKLIVRKNTASSRGTQGPFSSGKIATGLSQHKCQCAYSCKQKK